MMVPTLHSTALISTKSSGLTTLGFSCSELQSCTTMYALSLFHHWTRLLTFFTDQRITALGRSCERHPQRIRHFLCLQSSERHVRSCLRRSWYLRHRQLLFQSIPLPLDGSLHQIRSLHHQYRHAQDPSLRPGCGRSMFRRLQRPNVWNEVDEWREMGWNTGSRPADGRVVHHSSQFDRSSHHARHQQDWRNESRQRWRWRRWLRVVDESSPQHIRHNRQGPSWCGRYHHTSPDLGHRGLLVDDLMRVTLR